MGTMISKLGRESGNEDCERVNWAMHTQRRLIVWVRHDANRTSARAEVIRRVDFL
jgi:hypothetical protein